MLGDAYRALGDFASALEEYGQVAPTATSRAALAYRVGQVHYAQGEPARAIEVYARAEDADAAAWSTAPGCRPG